MVDATRLMLLFELLLEIRFKCFIFTSTECLVNVIFIHFYFYFYVIFVNVIYYSFHRISEFLYKPLNNVFN